MKSNAPAASPAFRRLSIIFSLCFTHCWGCDSSDLKRVYRITNTTCNCPDFIKHAKRGQAVICKHLWAGPGAPAAMLIHLLRQCNALWQLRQTGELYAPTLPTVPAGFVQTARDEYRAAVDRIVRRITFDLEAVA
mgnify:CR=1 FL=1